MTQQCSIDPCVLAVVDILTSGQMYYNVALDIV